jgi:hypothetical protein
VPKVLLELKGQLAHKVQSELKVPREHRVLLALLELRVLLEPKVPWVHRVP